MLKPEIKTSLPGPKSKELLKKMKNTFLLLTHEAILQLLIEEVVYGHMTLMATDSSI